MAAACQRDLPVADALNKTVAGVGPVVCREAAWRAFDGEHLLANELTEAQKVRLMAAIDELKEIYDAGGCPCSVTAPDGKPVEYTFFRPRQYGEKYRIKEWPSFNAMLEGYYAEKDRAERLRTKSKELHKAVHNMYERAVRKQAARQEELAASGRSEKLRLYGELLSANLYLAEKGMKSITVPNWYDEAKRSRSRSICGSVPAKTRRTSSRTTRRSRRQPGCWWTCWPRARRRSPIWKRCSTRWRRLPARRR